MDKEILHLLVEEIFREAVKRTRNDIMQKIDALEKCINDNGYCDFGELDKLLVELHEKSMQLLARNIKTPGDLPEWAKEQVRIYAENVIREITRGQWLK